MRNPLLKQSTKIMEQFFCQAVWHQFNEIIKTKCNYKKQYNIVADFRRVRKIAKIDY
jgi:hypothetical protein